MKKIWQQANLFFQHILADQYYYPKYLRMLSILFHPQLTINEAESLEHQVKYLENKLKSIDPNAYYKNAKLHNKFFYEFIPTIILAKQVEATALSLIEDDAKRYDAELIYSDREIEKIEWVTAMRHPYNGVRKKITQKDRTSWLKKKLEHVQKSYSPKSLPPHSAILQRYTQDLINRIIINFDKKLEKQKEGAYQGMTLGIFIDDQHIPQSVELGRAIEHIQQSQNHFSSVYLVGQQSFFQQVK